MGTLTYTQMVTEVQGNMGNRTFDSARLLNIMNLVQIKIARKPKWKELKATTDDVFVITASEETDKFLDVPANTRNILTFRVIENNGQSRKLKRRSTRQFDRLIPEPEYYSRGDPTIYTEFNDKLELWRVPDEADRYLIRRTTWPTPFTGGASELSDLDNKDDLIIALATSWVMRSIGRVEDSKGWWVIYKAAYDNAVEENDNKPDEEVISDDQMLERPGEYWANPFVRDVY